jgi:hypothetical protein
MTTTTQTARMRALYAGSITMTREAIRSELEAIALACKAAEYRSLAREYGVLATSKAAITKALYERIGQRRTDHLCRTYQYGA